MQTALPTPPSIQKRTRLATFSVTLVLFALVWLSPPARAQVTLYTDETSFNAATASLNFTLTTFEGIAPTGGEVNHPYFAPLAVTDVPGNDDGFYAVADGTYDDGFLSLNGSANLVAEGDGVNFPPTVLTFTGGPVTAFGTEVGFRDSYGGDNSSSDPVPLTDKLDVQLYKDSVPVGSVFHLDSFATGYVGFVSTVPFDQVAFTTINPGLTYGSDGYQIPDPYAQVYDNVRFGVASTLPTVTVVGSDPNADVSTHQAGAFVVALSAAAAMDLQVAYTVKGSATPGSDYKKLPGTVTIPAGATSAKIKVKPKGNLGGGGSKVIKLTLQAGTGYLVGTPNPVKLKIKP